MYTISNCCGGDARTFRFRAGEITGTAIKHADRIERSGFPAIFDGGDAAAASDQYDQIKQDRHAND